MAHELVITTYPAEGRDDVTIMHLRGWWDIKSEESMFQKANESYQKGNRKLVLDCSNMDLITSAGMRSLTKIYNLYTPKTDQDKVTYVRLANANPDVLHVLTITAFVNRIPHYETVQGAIDAFKA